MFKTFKYFSNKFWFHIMLIRITNREDHDQTASSANTFKQLSYSAHQFIIMYFPNEYQDDYFFYFLTDIANYHYGDVAKIDSLISLGISVGLRVDFPNGFRGFTMCSAGQ